jgi:hypothetical protein
LARKLFEEALRTVDDAAARYVLLAEARDLAAQSGETDLAVSAVDKLAAGYEVDRDAMLIEALEAVLEAARSSIALKELAGVALAEMDQSVAGDRFETAMAYGRTAYDAAAKARDKALVESIRARAKFLLGLKKEFARYEQALATLEDQPDDAEANLVAGRYLCLVKGDWERGLPMMAGGGEPSWAEPAAEDLASPEEPAAQLEVADAWYALAEGKLDPVRGNLLDRAGLWYREALPALPTAEKGKVVQRLAAIKGFGRSTRRVRETHQDRPGGALHAPYDSSPSEPDEPAPSGQTLDVADDAPIDLLKRVDPAEHAVSGRWQAQGKDLGGSPSGGPAKLVLPAVPQGDYTLHVEFTRFASFDTVGVIVPVGGRQCLAALSFGGGPSGIDKVDGRRADKNPTTLAGALANERKYALDVSVKTDGPQASVTVQLDGRPFIFYRGPVDSLELDDAYALPHGNCPGLAVESPVLIHRVQLEMLSGKAKDLP